MLPVNGLAALTPVPKSSGQITADLFGRMPTGALAVQLGSCAVGLAFLLVAIKLPSGPRISPTWWEGDGLHVQRHTCARCALSSTTPPLGYLGRLRRHGLRRTAFAQVLGTGSAGLSVGAPSCPDGAPARLERRQHIQLCACCT